MSLYATNRVGGGGGAGVTVYTNFAAFPASAPNGTLAVDGSTHILYEYNTTSVAWEPTASNTAYLDALASAGSATSIGALDSQPENANGLALVAQVLSTQSADATHPGVVNNTSQTFSGQKTFSTGLTGTLTGAASLNILTWAIGAANGVAPLDAGTKIPVAYLPNTVMLYLGNWNASTNTPTLTDGTGVNGDLYRVSVAGTQNLGSGSQSFFVGDFVIYNGSIWQKSPGADGVISVNGAQGVVTVNAINQLTGDIQAGPASGSQSVSSTIAANVVTNSKLANMIGFTIKGNNTGASTNPTDLTPSQVSVMLGDVTSIGAVGSTPNSAGGSITGNILTLQPFSASFPGVVTVNPQTFAGDKTFTGAILAQSYSAQAETLVPSAASIGSLTNATSFIRLTGSTNTILKGIQAGANGQQMTIYNGSTGTLTLRNEDGSVGAAGRIVLTSASDLVVASLASVQVIYDASISRWVLVSSPSLLAVGTFDTQGPYPDGLGLVAGLIYAQSADAGNPGMVNTGVQTFAGDKTFTGSISAANVTNSATSLTIMSRDGNANTRVNSIIQNFTTTATAAGTTTLTVGSTALQQFTGTTTQTVVLPSATTLVVGQEFTVMNRSTGIVTVNANGGGLIQTMVGGSQAILTVTAVGTSAGSWDSQYSVSGIVAAIQPTIQTFLSSSGTYTKPSGVQYIRVRMVGGGGGGGGSSNNAFDAGTGGTGGTTTFGSSFLTCTGGTGGGGSSGSAVGGGAGGTATVGAGASGTSFSGGGGNAVANPNISSAFPPGGAGGASPFGGAGRAGQGGAIAGTAAATNTGSGGGGAGTPSSTGGAGAGGGAGGFIDVVITSPSATYAYSVGAVGGSGGAGSSGAIGGAGGSGYIEVTEYYTNFSVGTTTSVAAGTFLAGPTSGSAANPTFRALQPPTVSVVTTSSHTGGMSANSTGTYTLPVGVLYIRVRAVGGGGGGGGGGTSPATASNGTATTFGTSLITANAGSGAGGTGTAGGAGGTVTALGAGAAGLTFAGGGGQGGALWNIPTAAFQPQAMGGSGAGTAFGGGGGGGGDSSNPNGFAGAANTGAGGGGGGNNGANSSYSGSGGGGGAYVDALIASPAATYSYTVGPGGAGGTGNTTNGGSGADGCIEVTEYYQ